MSACNGTHAPETGPCGKSCHLHQRRAEVALHVAESVARGPCGCVRPEAGRLSHLTAVAIWSVACEEWAPGEWTYRWIIECEVCGATWLEHPQDPLGLMGDGPSTGDA